MEMEIESVLFDKKWKKDMVRWLIKNKLTQIGDVQRVWDTNGFKKYRYVISKKKYNSYEYRNLGNGIHIVYGVGKGFDLDY